MGDGYYHANIRLIHMHQYSYVLVWWYHAVPLTAPLALLVFASSTQKVGSVTAKCWQMITFCFELPGICLGIGDSARRCRSHSQTRSRASVWVSPSRGFVCCIHLSPSSFTRMSNLNLKGGGDCIYVFTILCIYLKIRAKWCSTVTNCVHESALQSFQN